MGAFEKKIKDLKGIGEKRAELYEKLGVFSVRDLLRYFPRDYEDRRKIAPLGTVIAGTSVCVRAAVITQPTQARIPGGTAMVRLRIADDSGEADVTFFNRVWVKNNLRVGEEYIFYGLFQQWKNARGSAAKRLSLVNPVFERVREDGQGSSTGRIMPVYRLTAGLGQQHLRLPERVVPVPFAGPAQLDEGVGVLMADGVIEHLVVRVHDEIGDRDALDRVSDILAAPQTL